MKNSKKDTGSNILLYIIIILIIFIIAYGSTLIYKYAETKQIIDGVNSFPNEKNYTLKVINGDDAAPFVTIKYKDGKFYYENAKTSEKVTANINTEEYIIYDNIEKEYASYPASEGEKLLTKHLPDKIEGAFAMTRIFPNRVQKEKFEGKDVYIYITEDEFKKYIIDAKTKKVIQYEEKIQATPNMQPKITKYDLEVGNVKDDDVKKPEDLRENYTLKDYPYMQRKMEDLSNRIEETLKKGEEVKNNIPEGVETSKEEKQEEKTN